MVQCVKKHIITIVAASLVLIAVVVTVVVVVTRNKGNGGPKILTVIKNNEELKRPNINLNAEMELVKMDNNMKGLIISDPYASKFHIQLTMNYGSFIDTISGISHFGEHMVLQSCEKYNTLYPFFNAFDSIKNSEFNAETGGIYQTYFIALPFNLVYEKAMDMLTEAFRHPLYSPELIKNEAQAVNHEFYENIKHMERIEHDMIRLLSKDNISFNGIGCGNNETLNPSDSEKLSKILKGYHMVIKNPNQIFFTLYSNKTMSESEEIAKKYLNYKMHIFPDSEIDDEDKKKLEQNMKDIKNIELFDNSLYNHGIYYNSITKSNMLTIYYYIGKIEISKLHFDFIDYINYLLFSESLLKILRDKNYIIMSYYIGAGRDNIIYDNAYFNIRLKLTENGFNNINDILLIINKYIDIIKEEGYQEKYFNDFVKYMNNKFILKFNKEKFFSTNSFSYMAENLEYCSSEEFLFSGKLTKDNYNPELLKNHLERINFNKSFYAVNSKETVNETYLSGTLKSPQHKKLKYFNADYIIGEIPDDVLTNIKNTSIKINGLKIRDISPYFSDVYNDTVTPCYKEKENKCKEKNEFNYEKEDKYNSTRYNGSDDVYITYYQIDKSSESHLVYSNIKFQFKLPNAPDMQLILLFEQTYMEFLFKEFLEISDIFSNKFDNQNMILEFTFKAFSDNTEKILKKFLDLFSALPSEENFDYSKLLAIENLRQKKDIEFQSYILNIYRRFKKQTIELDNVDGMIEGIKSITFEVFKNTHSKLLNYGIGKINFNIAGNINIKLIENIHNYIRTTIPINNVRLLLEEPVLKEDNSPSVVNYYQKSTSEDPKNGIIVAYEFPKNFTNYINIFRACFWIIELNYLRFNYTNAYTPLALTDENNFIILEKGLYKEVDQMEDDIDRVLLGTLEGKINVSNYKEIVESYTTQEKAKKEKTLDNLFEEFINPENNANSDNFTAPQTFKELVDIVAPIFKQPKRTTILIARNTLSNDEFDAMYERRSKIKEYSLNKDINITHTKNMPPN